MLHSYQDPGVQFIAKVLKANPTALLTHKLYISAEPYIQAAVFLSMSLNIMLILMSGHYQDGEFWVTDSGCLDDLIQCVIYITDIVKLGYRSNSLIIRVDQA